MFSFTRRIPRQLLTQSIKRKTHTATNELNLNTTYENRWMQAGAIAGAVFGTVHTIENMSAATHHYKSHQQESLLLSGVYIPATAFVGSWYGYAVTAIPGVMVPATIGIGCCGLFYLYDNHKESIKTAVNKL